MIIILNYVESESGFKQPRAASPQILGRIKWSQETAEKYSSARLELINLLEPI